MKRSDYKTSLTRTDARSLQRNRIRSLDIWRDDGTPIGTFEVRCVAVYPEMVSLVILHVVATTVPEAAWELDSGDFLALTFRSHEGHLRWVR